MHLTYTFHLPASKSESNRALIMTALSAYQQGIPFSIKNLQNLSQATDTQILISILSQQENPVWDAKEAGTTFRFLTAFAVATKKNVKITGSERMKQRPIKVLVEALRSLGANIQYVEKEGFPPLQVWAKDFVQTRQEIDIQADVSSQYISALLMIAPVLDKGLRLNLVGKVASRPYIEMTLRQMEGFGVLADFRRLGTQIFADKKNYISALISIENDWSAASYVYAFAALAESAEIFVSGLKRDSLQGDKKIAELMLHFGVETVWEKEGIILRKKAGFIFSNNKITIDFSDIPDLAQTIVVLAAATGAKIIFTGLESLRIKETDRIAALQIELRKFGVDFEEIAEGIFTLFGSFIPAETTIFTYKDHRMAMAFAPLLLKIPALKFENPEVVAKSFPHFWEEVRNLLAE